MGKANEDLEEKEGVRFLGPESIRLKKANTARNLLLAGGF